MHFKSMAENTDDERTQAVQAYWQKIQQHRELEARLARLMSALAMPIQKSGFSSIQPGIEVKNRKAGSSKPASPVLQVVICNRSQPLRIGLVPRLVLVL